MYINYNVCVYDNRVERISNLPSKVTYVIPLNSILLCCKVVNRFHKKSNTIAVRCILSNLTYFTFHNLTNSYSLYQIISDLVKQHNS